MRAKIKAGMPHERRNNSWSMQTICLVVMYLMSVLYNFSTVFANVYFFWKVFFAICFMDFSKVKKIHRPNVNSTRCCCCCCTNFIWNSFDEQLYQAQWKHFQLIALLVLNWFFVVCARFSLGCVTVERGRTNFC